MWFGYFIYGNRNKMSTFFFFDSVPLFITKTPVSRFSTLVLLNLAPSHRDSHTRVSKLTWQMIESADVKVLLWIPINEIYFFRLSYCNLVSRTTKISFYSIIINVSYQNLTKWERGSIIILRHRIYRETCIW